jgi:hypothetical protein
MRLQKRFKLLQLALELGLRVYRGGSETCIASSGLESAKMTI